MGSYDDAVCAEQNGSMFEVIYTRAYLVHYNHNLTSHGISILFAHYDADWSTIQSSAQGQIIAPTTMHTC